MRTSFSIQMISLQPRSSCWPGIRRCCLIMTLFPLCRLYKGLTPLWGRQIPYTMMKFGASSCPLCFTCPSASQSSYAVTDSNLASCCPVHCLLCIGLACKADGSSWMRLHVDFLTARSWLLLER